MMENMIKLFKYKISADGGKTWTEQWLTEAEAEEELSAGYIVLQFDPVLFFRYI